MRRRRLIAASATALFAGCLSGTASDRSSDGESTTEGKPDIESESGTDSQTGTDSETDTQSETETRSFIPSTGRRATQSVEAIDRFSAREGSGDPFETVTVGDGVDREGDKPHEVVVWNDGDERVLDVVIESSAPRYEGHQAFPADGYLLGELTERVPYTLGIGAKNDRPARVPLPADVVDCNDSRTVVRVAPDGGVTYSTMSTTMACRVSPSRTP